MRSKLAVSFACVDVFGAQRPCSCTLAASGCVETEVPLAQPRLHTPAEAQAELQVLLPLSPADLAHGSSSRGPSTPRGYGTSMLLSAAALISPRRSDTHGSAGLATTEDGRNGNAFSAVLHARASLDRGAAAERGSNSQQLPSPSPRQLHRTTSGGGSGERHSASRSGPLQGPRDSAYQYHSGMSGACYISGGSAPASGGGFGGGSPCCPAGASLDLLPRHVRAMADSYSQDLRAFWVLPLYAPAPAAAAAQQRQRRASGGVDRDRDRQVLGVLYMMDTDETLFHANRETVDLFRTWLADAIVEAQLPMLADLCDSVRHAANLDTALATIAETLTHYFTHRTEGMSEVLCLPAFPQPDEGSIAMLLPPVAARYLMASGLPPVDSAKDLSSTLAPATNGLASGSSGSGAAPAAAAAAPELPPPQTIQEHWLRLQQQQLLSLLPAFRPQRTASLGTVHSGLSMDLQSSISSGAPGLQPFSVPLRGSLMAASAMTGLSAGVAPTALAASPTRCLPPLHADVAVLPGRPQYVMAGVMAPGGTAAAADAPSLGLYLTLSEHPKDALLTELQSTLDALMVLLAGCFCAVLGGDLRPEVLQAMAQAAARPLNAAAAAAAKAAAA